MKIFKNMAVLSSALVMSFVLTAVSVHAEDATEETSASADSAQVYVTIADKDGKLALVQEAVTVTDTDNDGILTVNDALFQAHEDFYEGGAEAGYASGQSQYGLSLEKLWGTANGGSFGYYVNDTASSGLADEIQDGDFLNAFVYTDLTAWSDAYCFFDSHVLDTELGETIELTLSRAGYDESWNPVTLPVENAVILIDGEPTEIGTDADGKFTLHFNLPGTYTISAMSETLTLVPPVCVMTVNGEAETDSETESESESESESETETETETESETETETETSSTTKSTTTTVKSTTASKTTTTAKSTTATTASTATASPSTGDKTAPVLVTLAGILSAGMTVMFRKHKN
ncbi:MAG: hypothetical protein E7496_07490 [Ruminococcus sp.]|nr:hypothetical protein [Ruminococcus sp.]